MSDRFSRISISLLLNRITEEYRKQSSILGISDKLFFRPDGQEAFRSQRFGKDLGSPIGVAAGPHSQMAQNIIAAWLCGARYIELKTVQTLDELEISKPCIDMQDEGYNCEWSQELKIHDSLDEYINAWIIIHYLHSFLGFSGKPEVIFNMSAGYNLEGILKENVQQFFKGMQDASEAIAAKKAELTDDYPEIQEIDIPTCISDSITLSTMHGCPPDEIEKIASYLIQEKKFHTLVKFNPTLLGPDTLREILNRHLLYPTIVPDEAFEHDLKYPDALNIIRTLTNQASECGVDFGLKLTNTLESVNHRNIFPEKEKMMYMSGRALHPLSVRLAYILQKEFEGKLEISFSAGADCFNITDLLAAGMNTVTVSSDLLKPGGYGRLSQYIENLKQAFIDAGAEQAEDFVKKMAKLDELPAARIKNLETYNELLKSSSQYSKDLYHSPQIKTTRALTMFDCIAAPCVGTCPSNQEIPQYLYHASRGELTTALEVILNTNPFPHVCGMVCDHICQSKCTRVNYDQVIRIREIKRYITENAAIEKSPAIPADNGQRVAIIGAGPSGLACAWFLRLAGSSVAVFEAKNLAGGMVADAIPAFRLSEEAIRHDLDRILEAGVSIEYGKRVDKEFFDQLRDQYDAIYLAVGAEKARRLNIEGEDLPNVLDPLKFLSDFRRGKELPKAQQVLVIGGGNTAMDVARTSKRLAGPQGKVTLVYRRSRAEMPAHAEEIDAALNDGIELLELTAPVSIKQNANGGLELICRKVKLGEKDSSGRNKPIEIPGSEFSITTDLIIPAAGQVVNAPFFKEGRAAIHPTTFETQIPNVFMGGDAFTGGASIIRAIGDGKKVAATILSRKKISASAFTKARKEISREELMIRRSRRIMGIPWEEESYRPEKAFHLVSKTMDRVQAEEEAARCLYCDEMCNICVTVCPNRANQSCLIPEISIPLYLIEPSIKEKNVNITSLGTLAITQREQVYNIADFCNECGNCTTFCPTSGRPFKDKPKVCLTPESFNAESKAYYLSSLDKRTILIHKEGGSTATLEYGEKTWDYEDENMHLSLDKKDFGVSDLRFFECDPKAADTRRMAEMIVVYHELTP